MRNETRFPSRIYSYSVFNEAGENGRFRFLRIYVTEWLVSVKSERSLEIDAYAPGRHYFAENVLYGRRILSSFLLLLIDIHKVYWLYRVDSIKTSRD